MNLSSFYRNKTFLVIVCIVIVFFIIRVYLATISSYAFYHGWNEGHYSLIAKGYFEHSLLMHEKSGSFIGAVPPFYSWVVFAFFKAFGISDVSARLTSIFATLFATPFVYLLARELYSREVAILSVPIFLSIPWVVMLSGGVQTDMLMTAFITASIACFVYAYNHNSSFIPFGIFFGLALFTKQPAVLALLVLAVWLFLVGGMDGLYRTSKKSLIPILIGLIPILAYILYHFSIGNLSGVIRLVYGEAVHRMVPFSNIKNVLAGVLAGISPLVLIFAFYELYKSKGLKNLLVIWIIIFGLFVIARTPYGHEYYILPLSVPFAILASKGINSASKIRAEQKWKKLVVVMGVVTVLSTIPFSYALLSYTGDLGYTCTEDVVSYISDEKNKVGVLVQGRYKPQVTWYSDVNNLNAKIIGLPIHLSSVSIEDLKEKSSNISADDTYLIIDGRSGIENRLEESGYDAVYVSYYETKLPNMLAGAYTGEKGSKESFVQYLAVYKLR